MGFLDWVAVNLGLFALTLTTAGLTVYLIYAMIHPERF
jgi:K+-transporting ATPase KdpF subunit